MLRRLLPYLTLFSTFSTLICCALPAAFVALGFGATLVALLGTFPQLIWLSTHKVWVFGIAGLLLLMTAGLRLHSSAQSCPVNYESEIACRKARAISSVVFWLSLALFLIGALFAFLGDVVF